MSKRSDLKGRLHALGEIKSILGAMKSLSIIETNKVARYLGAQTELMETIERVLVDFEQFFKSGPRQPMGEDGKLYILVGSERGFCGGFNEAVIARFEEVAASDSRPVKIIVVGRKIAAKLDGDARIVETLDGPSAAEEIAGTIAELARVLAGFPNSRWTLIHHEDGDAHGRVAAVCPFSPQAPAHSRKEAFAPLLNVSAAELYPQLFEQYLFSVLYRAFYLSFLAENHERLRHMEGALSSLDRKWSRMRRLSNALRQEEITEELEVIMLSVNA